MANTIKLKRSGVAGKVPTTSDLAIGEIGLNYADAVLYARKSVGGVDSIVQIGGGGPIAQTQQVISQNLTLTTGYNGFSVGPVEVAATYAVTVPANATWMVL